MTWNHRIIRRVSPHGETYYALHEVHYPQKGDDTPTGRSTEPTTFVGETPEDLIASLQMALDNVRKWPVLDDPWPDSVEPQMLSPFPADRTIAEELSMGGAIQFCAIDGTAMGLRTGALMITSKIEGIAPRVKYTLNGSTDEEAMSVSISEDSTVVASSLPAFFRHFVGPEISAWVRLNYTDLMTFWNDGWDHWPDINAFRASLKPYEKFAPPPTRPTT